MKKLRRYTKIKIIGIYPEQTIDFCIKKNMYIRDIIKKNGVIEAYIRPRDLSYMKKISEKFSSQLEYEEAKPLLRDKVGITLGVATFLLIINFMSGYIWEIGVSGNNYITQTDVKNVLESAGIKEGKRVSKEQLLQAESLLKERLPEIEWTKIEKKGSRINVKVTDKILLDKDSDKIHDSEPCNIVASREGIIIDTNVTAGKLVTPKGSGVREGDLIVSGFYIISEQNVTEHARASIIARCTEEVEFFEPYNKEFYKETGEKVAKNYVSVLTYEVPSLLNVFSGDMPKVSNFETEIRKINIFGLEMPFKSLKKIYAVCEKQTIQRTNSEVTDMLKDTAKNYRENFLKDCNNITEELQFIEKDTGISLIVNYTFETDIAKEIGN